MSRIDGPSQNPHSRLGPADGDLDRGFPLAEIGFNDQDPGSLSPETLVTIATLHRRPWILQLDPAHDPQQTLLDALVRQELDPILSATEGEIEGALADMFLRFDTAIAQAGDEADLRRDLEEGIGGLLRMLEHLHLARMANGG